MYLACRVLCSIVRTQWFFLAQKPLMTNEVHRMLTCRPFTPRSGEVIPVPRSRRAAGTILLVMAALSSAHAQSAGATDLTAQSARSFSLSDTSDLTGIVPANGRVEAVEYLGRKAVRLTAPSSEDSSRACSFRMGSSKQISR